MKILTTTAALTAVLLFWWHEFTEPYEPDGDSGDGWRTAVAWLLIAAWLIAMAVIAALGALDDIDRRRIAAGRPTRAEQGRHRRLYADRAITTHGTIRFDPPIVWVTYRTPAEVVLDEQPTGGER